MSLARIGGDEFVLARFVGPGGDNDGQMLAADVIDAFPPAVDGLGHLAGHDSLARHGAV